MIEHIKKLFLAIIGLTCFTCFQRADYNLPLFAFAFFLWDYKHPNVLVRINLVSKTETFLFIHIDLGGRFHLAHLLGSNMEF